MATSPAPDAAAPPGMCPGIAVLGGGGDGGGGDGSGNGGKEGADGGGDGKGKGAAGDQKNAPGGKGKKGNEGEPVDVATGRVFTLPRTVLSLGGPLPLVIDRQYSSSAARRDVGLGFGWAHSLGWRITTTRLATQVWTDEGISVDFERLRIGDELQGPWGWILKRDASGYVLDKDDGLRWIFSLAHDDEWLLTAVEDRCENRIALTHEGGRLVEVRDSVGRRVRFTPGPHGRVGAVEVLNAVAQGRWIAFERYEYDDRGRLVTATDAEGYALRYAYDERNLLVRHTDRVGLSFHYRYDEQQRCVETWGDWDGRPDPSLAEGLPEMLADGETPARGIYHRKIDYMPGGYREVADSRQVRRYFTNRHGLVDKVVDGGRVVSAEYDAQGHQISETDAVKATTRYERDERGRLLRVVDPLGRETRVERDALGEVIRITNAAGGVRELARDRSGNVVTARNPLGAATSLEYDERGLLTAMRDPNGGMTRIERDAHGNVVRLVQPNGRTWQWQHDFLGQRVAEIDPAGALRRYRLSERGDVVAEITPTGASSSFRFDGEHHLTERIDPAGGRFLLRWGGLHSLVERVDAGGRSTRLHYDREGDLLEVENQRGEKYRFTHDSLGNLLEERTFDGRRTRYRRDPEGRIVQVESGAGELTQLAYNRAGELIEMTLDDGTSQSFERDPLGDIVRMVWPEGECRFERDAIGRIVREVQRLGTESHSVEIGYLPNGQRATRSTSLGHALRIERDPDGIPLRTTYNGEHVVLHENDALGREIVRTLPGGGRIESQFDPAGSLVRRSGRRSTSRHVVGAGEPDWLGPRDQGLTVDKSYRYDPVGQLVETVDGARGATQYEHDPAGRLLAALTADGTEERFAYDPTGNLLRDGATGQDLAYGPGSRLLRKGATEYRWDDDGRLAEKREQTAGGSQVWRYRWNARGLLAAVAQPDGTTVEFSYDPLARRIEKRVLDASVPGAPPRTVSRARFVWDHQTLVHEIRQSATAAGDPIIEERTYAFADEGFTPEAHRQVTRSPESEQRSGWFHYLNDPIGTPERLIRDDGVVAAELRRTTWGKTETAPGAETTTPIRFQGQYEDEETGLCYNRYRYYDPETGRFISADPIGLEGGLNLFARGENPVQLIDALGLAGRYPLDLVHTPRSMLTPDERVVADDMKRSRGRIRPGTLKCEQLAQDFAKGDPRNREGIQMTPYGTADNLDPKPGVLPPGVKGWGQHSATELRDGRVVDVDRGIMFENRKQWVDRTVKDPSAVTTTYPSWATPKEEKRP